MSSITSIYPRPREVTLGGRTFTAGELRVADLADLQDWLDRGWASPLEPLRDRLGTMGEADRRAALCGIWDEADEGPPSYGDERSRDLFATGAGILEIFRVALRRHHPELDVEAVTAIAERTSPAEYASLRRVLFGVSPMDEIEAWLGIDQGPSGSPIGWPQAVCEVCELYGWTLDHVEGLALSQFRAARSGGKPVVRGTSVAPKTNLAEVVAKARAKFQSTGVDHG